MPISGASGKGNLIIRFKIDFPKYLDDTQKAGLEKILGSGAE